MLAGAAFALTHRETQPKPAVAALTVLYGIPGSDATIDPLAPGGLQTVCTEEELATGAQSWTCVAWAVNTQHLPVVPPAQYQGACTHLLADRNEARWTCLGAQPISPQQLPPSAPPASSS